MKAEHPHPLSIIEPQVLAAELERVRRHYKSAVHESFCYVTPNDEHEGAVTPSSKPVATASPRRLSPPHHPPPQRTEERLPS
ncbi:MAG: hypothetical protein WKF86_06530 [Acidimicrobiales bacterium]